MSKTNKTSTDATPKVSYSHSDTATVQDMPALLLSQGARILPPSQKLREVANRCAAIANYQKGMPTMEIEF